MSSSSFVVLFIPFSGAYKWGPLRANDHKCGLNIRADCDRYGSHPCCSKHGWCGKGDNYCKCDGCVDFRGKLILLLTNDF